MDMKNTPLPDIVASRIARNIAAEIDIEITRVLVDALARITPITHELRLTANESLEDHLKRCKTRKSITF